MTRQEERGYLLPVTIDPPTIPVTLCIPCDPNHALALMGQIVALGYWWTWERDPLHKGKDAARVWRDIANDLSCQLNDCGVFMGTCGCGTGLTETRVTPEGVVEISTDGGETWTPAPGLDPRKTSIQFPPLTGEDGDLKKCKSAQNVQESLESWVDNLSSILTLGGIVIAGVTAFIGTFLSGGALIGLSAPFAGFLTALGGSALSAAFTSDTWDDVTCCLLDNVAADGTYDDAAWENVTACLSGIGGAAGTVLYFMASNMGAIGISNIAASGSSAGDDCDNCVCNSEDELNREIWSTIENEITNPAMSGTYIDPGTGRWAFRDDSSDYIQLDMGEPEGTRVTEYWIGTPYCCSDGTFNLYLDDTPNNLGGGTLIATWNATLDGADTWHVPDVVTEGRYARWELVASTSVIYFGAIGFSRFCP